MKEYIFLVEIPGKIMFINYTRGNDTTIDQMTAEIAKYIADNFKTTEFIIKGVFKL